MDKVRITPPDPMESAQMPIDDVAVPATETEIEPSDAATPDADDQGEHQYVENEGLDGAQPPPREDIERSGAS